MRALLGLQGAFDIADSRRLQVVPLGVLFQLLLVRERVRVSSGSSGSNAGSSRCRTARGVLGVRIGAPLPRGSELVLQPDLLVAPETGSCS